MVGDTRDVLTQANPSAALGTGGPGEAEEVVYEPPAIRVTEPEGAPGSTADPDVSVVMPCLNEAASVAACVASAFEGIRRTGMTGEVVVVDNGSGDGSARLAASAGARVVHQPERGYGNAYRAGFAEAKGRIVVMGDSDGTYDFTQIPALIAPINDDGADCVLGSRFRGRIEPGAMSWSHRYIGNPVLTCLLNVLFGLRSTDAHSGLRAFRRQALQDMGLRCEGMELASEIVVKAARSNLVATEVPIVYHPRTGRSKLSAWRDGWRHLRFLLLLSPLHVFVWPGLLLSAAGVFAQALAFVLGGPRPGLILSMPGVCAMLLGVQLLALGLFAKAYVQRAGLEAGSPASRFVERTFSLERGLLSGAVLALVGAALALASLVGNFGGRSLGTETAALGLAGLVLGAQLSFCSFFVAFFRFPGARSAEAGAVVLS